MWPRVRAYACFVQVLQTAVSQPASPTQQSAARARLAAARSSSVRDLMAGTLAGASAGAVVPTISWVGFFECISAVLMDFMTEELQVVRACVYAKPS